MGMAIKMRLLLLMGFSLALVMGVQSASAQSPEGTGVAIDGERPTGPSLAVQSPIPIGGTWVEFSHLGPDTFALGCLQGGDPNGLLCTPSSAGNSVFGPAPPWTFTAPPAGVTLTVTDAFLRGEIFEVFDFGASLGTTSNVAPGGSCGDNPDTCLADPLTSHSVFNLAAGSHEITIKVVASAFGVGAAYFRVDAAEAKADHFVCYKVDQRERREHREEKGKKADRRVVLVTNQFGEQTFTVEEPDTLCVPSTKTEINNQGR